MKPKTRIKDEKKRKKNPKGNRSEQRTSGELARYIRGWAGPILWLGGKRPSRVERDTTLVVLQNDWSFFKEEEKSRGIGRDLGLRLEAKEPYRTNEATG